MFSDPVITQAKARFSMALREGDPRAARYWLGKLHEAIQRRKGTL